MLEFVIDIFEMQTTSVDIAGTTSVLSHQIINNIDWYYTKCLNNASGKN